MTSTIVATGIISGVGKASWTCGLDKEIPTDWTLYVDESRMGSPYRTATRSNGNKNCALGPTPALALGPNVRSVSLSLKAPAGASSDAERRQRADRA